MTDIMNGLDRVHRLQPVFTLCGIDLLKAANRFALVCEVIDESAIAHHEPICPDTRFYPCQETTHCRSIAVPDISNSGRVDLLVLGQYVHATAQVHNKLDLFVTVPRRKRDPVSTTDPRRGRADGQYDRLRVDEVLCQWKQRCP